MAELTQSTSIEQATLEELNAMIVELEQYRERLVSDTLEMAKRAKVMKAQAQTNLEPALERIDAMLEELRKRQATIESV